MTSPFRSPLLLGIVLITAVVMACLNFGIVNPSVFVPTSGAVLVLACVILPAIYLTLADLWRMMRDPAAKAEALKQAKKDHKDKNYY